MSRLCDACGAPAFISMGGAMLCRACDVDVKEEIDRLRSQGKPVNAMHIARKIFKETHSAGAYQLRDIPKDLWDAAKHAAIDRGISLRDLILEALKKEIETDGKIPPPPHGIRFLGPVGNQADARIGHDRHGNIIDFGLIQARQFVRRITKQALF
jgi:uncharacterized Zn finger protein (UPF0148 family)